LRDRGRRATGGSKPARHTTQNGQEAGAEGGHSKKSGDLIIQVKNDRRQEVDAEEAGRARGEARRRKCACVYGGAGAGNAHTKRDDRGGKHELAATSKVPGQRRRTRPRGAGAPGE